MASCIHTPFGCIKCTGQAPEPVAKIATPATVEVLDGINDRLRQQLSKAQTAVEMLTTENDRLKAEVARMRELTKGKRRKAK